MRPADDIKKYFQKSTLSTDPDRHETVFEKIQRAQDQSKDTAPALSGPKIRNTIMKSPITKIAAAAAVIAATILGFIVFIDTGSTSGIVWAQVAEQVQASQGFVCRSNVTLTNVPQSTTTKIDTRMYGSPSLGIRTDQYQDGEVVMSVYGNRADNSIISIMHSMKTYTRDPLPEGDLSDLEKMSPTELVRQYLSTQYKELGTDTIDGLAVKGIEVNDASVISTNFRVDSIVARLWVSKETGFPVRLEAEIIGNNGAFKMQAVMNEFQWNAELDAGLFKADIPADYALMGTPQP